MEEIKGKEPVTRLKLMVQMWDYLEQSYPPTRGLTGFKNRWTPWLLGSFEITGGKIWRRLHASVQLWTPPWGLVMLHDSTNSWDVTMQQSFKTEEEYKLTQLCKIISFRRTIDDYIWLIQDLAEPGLWPKYPNRHM